MRPERIKAAALALVCSLAMSSAVAAPLVAPIAAPGRKIASFYVSQDFINEQLQRHLKSEMIRELKVELEPDQDHIVFRGIAQVPIEELRAINLDPKLGRFRFQISAKLGVTRHGHLLIEFPLNETFFYPADSRHPAQERVIVPVQMLSIALASARGYLAALSGDFGGFDRRSEKLEALLKNVERAIGTEKNKEALDDLKIQRDSLRVQLASIPIERKQLQSVSKEIASVLGFTGENELRLDKDLAARKNAIVLKIKLSQLLPYLKGMELGGIRIVRNKKDGDAQSYFVLDVNSDQADNSPQPEVRKPSSRTPAKVPPSLVVRLRQALFESQAMIDAEAQALSSKVKDLKLRFQEDGLHVSGRVHVFLFVSTSFETIVDFVSSKKKLDAFDIRVRDIKVAGIDFEFLSKMILETVKSRLEKSLQGICQFEYKGERRDGSQALRVTVDPKMLVPAFPDLHLIDVDVREGEFLLKVGKG